MNLINLSNYDILREDRVYHFFSPAKILLGVGTSRQVGREAKLLAGKRALIITDLGVVKAGLLDGIRESILSEGIFVGIFDRVEIEPPSRIIDECAHIVRDEAYDIVIGLGGGSSLDTAKGASIMATNKGSVLDYIGIDLVPQKGLPKILIPTTGSGSEVTRVFAPTDERDGTKKVVYSNFNLADVVIVDPLLTISLPPDLTADTGMDALVAAIESFLSIYANPFSDMLAIEAIHLISKYLPIAFGKGDHIEARLNLGLSSLMANLSWQSASLGAVHALSFVLETECHLRHARAVSIMLPYVMEFNMIGNLFKFGQIARAMGESVGSLSPYEAAEKSIRAVKRLLEILNISIRLTDYGIDREKLPELVKGAMKEARLFVSNPRNLTQEDVRKIYLKAMEGT